MVRETRHLWVGNLPDNIREDRIREHFKRYGRVQNVKLLGRMENASANTNAVANSGVCATVAFMDIKSASKAHNVEHVLDERTLTTEYYEPAAIPSSAGAPSAGSSPAGSGYSGSSSSVNSAPVPVTTSRYHLSGEESAGNACAMAASAAAPATWRGTNDSATEYCRRGNTPAAYGRYQRNNSTAPYATSPSNIERTTPHNRWYANSGGASGGAAGGESTPSTPGGGTERRRRASGSGSSRSDSSSPEPSDTSRASTPAANHHAPHHTARRTPPPHPHQWPSTANGRPLAICVRNLPTRSTDSSLKDGLYHEYKKHGKVVWVKVVGQNADRYAVVRFKKPSDVEKALEVSQDKLFFGCKISVAPHQSCDDDAESAKPYETDIDEYHPKATRTLFIGNLEKDVTQQQLRDKFKHFGRIIEIDIKKGSGGGAGYAFCQYASISSVVEAIRAMDGEYVGNSRVKLGFGKPVATTCVWVDGLTEHTEKQVLGAVSRCGAATSVCVDRAAGAALVHFEQAAAAGGAVRELRRVAAQLSAAEPDHPRLCVDYASRECQEAFYEQLEKHGGSAALAGAERVIGDLPGRYATPRHETLRYEAGGTTRSRAPSFSRASSRTPRYNAQDHYDPADYAADRRYRVFDELGSSPQTDDATYEERLQSVVVSPHRGHKHRRDSSPEGRKHSKERHRSAGGGSRRSRSGSRGHASRRRHRKRRDGSESRGSRASRAGTPLRDELDAPPTEPRRPPRERPPLPMSLPLPKFAVQLLRAAPPQPRPLPPAPASPPRPPSASSSSGGSAPHSPSLEERIRSLDEKYERWTGSRAHVDAPDRSRLRHRFLELDINEVKPSEVVRSLLAKRSVFDEDSERLEGAARVPSPGGSPRAPPATPSRVLRYPFPAHGAHASASPGGNATTAQINSVQPPEPEDHDRLRLLNTERINKHSDEGGQDIKLRLRTPSTDRPMLDATDKKHSPTVERSENRFLPESETLGSKRRNSYMSNVDDNKTVSVPDKATIERINMEKSIEKSILEIQEKYNIKDNKIICEDKVATSVVSSIKKEDNVVEKILPKASDFFTKFERKCFREENKSRCQDIKQEIHMELNKNDNFLFTSEYHTKSELILMDMKQNIEHDTKLSELNCRPKENERFKDKYQSNKTIIAFRMQSDSHFSPINCIELPKKNLESNHESINIAHNKEIPVKTLTSSKDGTISKPDEDKIGTQRIENNDKPFDICLEVNNLNSSEEVPVDKVQQDFSKMDKEKLRYSREKPEKDVEREKLKNKQINSKMDKHDKERKTKEDSMNLKLHSEKSDRARTDKELDKITDKDRDVERSKANEEKSYRHDNHKKDKQERDRKKDMPDNENTAKSSKKEDKQKNDRSKKDSDSKRDNKREVDQSKSRKSSRDESSRDIFRKDSTDSTTSRASHESSKSRESENIESKEEIKAKVKSVTDVINKIDIEKDVISKHHDHVRLDAKIKIKSEIKEEKDFSDQHIRTKIENYVDNKKVKAEGSEKSRHYSLDSPSVDTKRKERLNSCSSLPSNIGHKRRMSSQDSIDCLNEEIKKVKSERRESKDSKILERHKTTKFSKGHFAKIIESKTKDDRKNQVKPPDDIFSNAKSYETKDITSEKFKGSRKSPIEMIESKTTTQHSSTEPLQNNFDFLATLELRSSEEDERQKALRKEMKEKKRIQQLQQIQELQMQQDALQQAEISNKIKDDRKIKSDEKKKEVSREKRLSTDRKSKDEKMELNKRRSRKQLNSTDTSDSDEPKKHSIFDIIDDEYNISMYDKVKARSCKNMQKQEEEKRQEKIKAKFSQLKQSRAKREEKKRSSWDEDSDSDNDRRKFHKVSMDSSSDEDHGTIHSKKREKSHGSSLEYDRNRTNDYFETISNEEDSRNKLSRKNSRTRIISDSSDEGDIHRKDSKSPCHIMDRIKKEVFSDSESSTKCKDVDTEIQLKQTSDDKVKKTSLLNLFGKSDSEDNRLKCTFENDNEYRMAFAKTFPNDLSSENESMPNRISSELRRKHKKKQKKYKFTYSDDDNKSNHDLSSEMRSKHKNSDKNRRHSSKKEKRKDKIRESIDTDELRDEKSKLEKRSPDQSYDSVLEALSNNNKKEGKMEDIFGPLSDESDREIVLSNNKMENLAAEFETTTSCVSDKLNSEELKMRDKEEIKRRKEKRRKEKRHFVKEDDNSLDVDAVSKAIEARLFADSNVDDKSKSEKYTDIKDPENELKYMGVNYKEDSLVSINKYNDKSKKESRERKKKKKRNREDRQSRKEHHHEKFQKQDSMLDSHMEQLSPKTILDIPLPTEIPKVEITDKSDDSKSLSESPSLPRITDSPTFALLSEEITNTTNECETPKSLVVDEEVEIDYEMSRSIEVTDIPMPPPIDNIVQDISEVPLPTDPPIDQGLQISLPDNVITETHTDVKENEDAVRSISNLEKDDEKTVQSEKSSDLNTCKADKKLEEKPRAIISQEETEDAVAALLGESFGGKVNTFDCYEEVECSTTHEMEIENTITESEIIPEEDAEEMRQAVQNLNASEMEMKPDTPVSDDNLLLIDTDTEETEEPTQDAIDRLPVNIIATNQSLNNNTKASPAPSTEVTNIVISKPTIVHSVSKEVNDSIKKVIEDNKPSVSKQETVEQITSTATPVITSWTLSNNKLIEPHVVNVPVTSINNRETSENKPTHITANIVQIKSPQNPNMHINNSMRPIINTNRLNTAPYQVINQIVRPQVSNIQPPTIKIPEPHIIYQKPQNIVISPRLNNDPILTSPKSSMPTEGMASPRLPNMALLNTSPQSVPSPNTMQQRSPGQVTVVRMQQQPLSPIHTMHIPHARAMVSPNRPKSVLVQTQGAPIQYNRLPVTPVLAPISKQINANNVIQQTKGSSSYDSMLIHQQKMLQADKGKSEMVSDASKIILSPTKLHNTNPTIVAQSRIIPMQSSLHVSNKNSTLNLSNKVLLNNKSLFSEKRDLQNNKSEHNITPLTSSPILHLAGSTHTSSTIIQASTKSVMCNLQEITTVSRGPGSNVIHSINTQRHPITNAIQLEANKCPPSVLSMATIRTSSSVKPESSNTVVVTTPSLANVVMTPLLLKTSPNPKPTIRLHTRSESEQADSHCHKETEIQVNKKIIETSKKELDQNKIANPPSAPVDHVAKCETDFEELLKDNINEIKIISEPHKKVDIGVGKTVPLISQVQQTKNSTDEGIIKQEEGLKILTNCETADNLSIKGNENDFSKTTNQENTTFSTSEQSSKSNDIGLLKPKTEDIDVMATKGNNDHLSTSCDDISDSVKSESDDNKNIFYNPLSNHSKGSENEIKNLDESDYWSDKDIINIESVIKKVDSLCNDSVDEKKTEVNVIKTPLANEIRKSIDQNIQNESYVGDHGAVKPEVCNDILKVTENKIETFHDNNSLEESVVEKNSTSKRGGRSVRGKRSEKNSDKVQTRQIAKTPRGTSKRGRGRVKVDKKIKNMINSNPNNMPGDVYDFHEDSGDETVTSPNKTEVRPRLILTIKSPLSGNSNAVVSTLSITQKDVKVAEKPKEEKVDVFASPSTNTRKSRRLQEKDIQRSSVDDIIDDVIKSSANQFKTNKDLNKKKITRQAGNKATDKPNLNDTRKSPRGVKRSRDRSLSDASTESCDENSKTDEIVKDSKMQKLVESDISISKCDPEPAVIKPIIITTPAVASCPPSNQLTIMKPPKKKMISEISAKLASAFEAAANATNRIQERSILPSERPSETERTPPLAEPSPGALGEGAADAPVGDAGYVRRLVDNVPPNMMPVGATEATDARVQSPALPHRPPSSHHLPDRVTPILVRGGDGEGGPMGALGASGAGSALGVVGAMDAGAALYRGAYAGPASLPRGAHHPPLAKQVAVIGQNHHPGSRVTITSVPSGSPQGQMALGEGMYPHFSHHHYQMYQQHFRATQQENRENTPTSFTCGGPLEAEGSEAPAPPLELRRRPPTARVPRPAHSPSQHDRHIMYAVRCGRSPPPAHGTSRPPSALPPPAAPGPPHASQVPREADSLQMLLRRYPVMWQGLLALKNDSAAVQMHFVGGNPGVAADALSRHSDGTAASLLRIAQRMRLEPAQLDQVHRKMKLENEHCMLLALPCGRDHMDVLQQSTNLTAGFITYLQRKQAAGIVNVAPTPGHHQSMYTVHIFPSCEFANENLTRIAPDLMHRVTNIAHLLIVIATAIG